MSRGADQPLKKTLARWLVNSVYPLLCRVLRAVWPLARFGRFMLVTRFDDVQEILTRSEDFVVPYAPKIQAVGWLPLPLLAQARPGEGYTRMLENFRELWREEDLARVRAIAREVTEAALEAGAGAADAMDDVVVPSVFAVIERYYGVRISDPEAFADAANALAGYIFGTPKVKDAAVVAAKAKADVIWADIDAALDADPPAGAAAETVVQRWQAVRDRIPREDFRSLLTIMIVGFVPAHTNAAGRALHVLLSKAGGRSAAVAAARAEGDEKLRSVAYEALRFLYILPVLWRTNETPVELRRDTPRPVRIRAGTWLMVSTWSAMRDRRRVALPEEFLANRSPLLYLTYGYHFHFCVGRPIADRLLAENLRGLFARGARRAPRTRTVWASMVPARIPVVYEVQA